MRTARILPSTEEYVDFWDEVHRSDALSRISWSELEARKRFRGEGEADKDGILSVLEIGCGRGEFLRFVSSRNRTVFGVEICPFLFSDPLHDLPVAPVDASDLSQFADGSWDLVVAINVLEFVEERDLALWIVAEAARIARVGALLSFGETLRYQGKKLDSPQESRYWRALIEHHFHSSKYWTNSIVRGSRPPTLCYAKHAPGE